MREFFTKYSQKPENFFKTLFFTFLFGYLPFMIVHMMLALTGVIPVNFNDEKIFGLKGVLIILAFAPLLVLLITLLTYFYFLIGNLILKIIKKLFYD